MSVSPAIVSVISVVLFLVGLAIGLVVYKIYSNKKLEKNKSNAIKIIEDAYAEAKTIKKEAILESKENAQKIKEDIEQEVKDRRAEVVKLEERLNQREEYIEKKELAVDKKSEQLDEEKKSLTELKESLEKVKEEEERIKVQILEELERVAKLSRQEAKDMLVENMKNEAQKQAAVIVKKIEDDAREEGEKKAREIIGQALQKCATDTTSEMTVSVVSLPNDEMKGRIIGREGRNIRAIEAATGVELIVDDTPETITVSGFDPIRREVARLSLEKLISDGRIHPTRIEEIVEKMQKEVDKMIKQAGDEACNETGLFNLNSELVKVLGRLKFRTSYGQNVLKHSIECSIIAGLLASEMGANVKIAKRGGLLHDIGKALDHELEGTHVQIGVELARKYGESEEVVHCIEAHHFNVEFKSIEAVIVQVADAISSSRPGARRDSFENYIKRLQQLEEIANGFKGVDKSFAVQAGREVRIIVKPDQISDSEAMFMAKEIANKIENEMQYPGQIKVNVIRESRYTETAK
ncbi:MAG: ribonuclease Y [Clostridiales bacterium]|nr:ribonuclease Y [Clostridiales bacterium]